MARTGSQIELDSSVQYTCVMQRVCPEQCESGILMWKLSKLEYAQQQTLVPVPQ
jgi:hypothetical protein